MTDADLQAELLRRMDLDQVARQRVDGHSDDPRTARWAAVAAVDSDNTSWLAGVVARSSSWPKLSEVGENAAMAAWVLAQHADDAPDVQVRFHQQMTAAVADGEADPKLLAFLEDRILVNAGQPQLYGTQFISDEAGGLRPRPIQDLDGLDERRAAVRLEPFAEYEATMHANWIDCSAT
jgi:hypothetical protein